jgi:hypothetical protein
MPVAVNVPVVLDDVDESLPPQETKAAPIQAIKAIEKIFFICKARFI